MGLSNKISNIFEKYVITGGLNPYEYADYLRKKGLSVGKDCYIIPKNLGIEKGNIRIGNNCWVVSGVKFIDHDASVIPIAKSKQISEKKLVPQRGKINIKDNCFIGDSSIVMFGVTIGPNSVVGAGSIVTKDVPPDTVVAGIPAKFLSSIDEWFDKKMKKD